MPARSAAEKAERKLAQQQKREARKAAKEQKQIAAKVDATGNANDDKKGAKPKNAITTGAAQQSLMLELPDVAMHSILSCLPSRDVGCLTMTCRAFNEVLVEGRVPYLMSRINRPNQPIQGTVGYVDLCSNEAEAR